MTPLRKILGFILAALIGIPILFGTIIAVGITNAVVTPEVLSDLPREIIKELPSTVDEIYSAIKSDENINNEKTRIWVDAIKKSDIPPGKMLEESGIFEWLRLELSESLKQVGEVLQGERSAGPINLDMKPLKRALLHESVTKYFKIVIRNLPECTDVDVEEWKNIAFLDSTPDDFSSFPACRPAGLEISDDLIMNFQRRAIDDMPDNVNIAEDWTDFPARWNFTKTISTVTYALFIIPGIFILLGSFIAATSKGGFFRWAGITTMIGGGLAYGLTSLLQNLLPISELSLKYDFAKVISSDFEELVISKVAGFSEMIFDSIFTPASRLGGTVIIIGLIIFALSFLIRERDHS